MNLARIAVAVAFLATAFAATRVSNAQCGAKQSTCSACHDGARAAFTPAAAWHSDHRFADVCAVCHGGRPDAAFANDAHVGLVPPLGAEAAQCRSCHGVASEALAQRYARNDAGADTGGASGASSRPSSPRPEAGPEAPPHASNDRLAGTLAVLLGALGLAWVLRRERPRTHLLERLRAPDWSPYLGGVLLGVVVTVSLGLFGHRLSGAGAYQQLSGIVGQKLAPGSIYWTHLIPTGLTWEVAIAIGAFAGAFVSSRLAGTFRLRTMPDTGWREIFGSSTPLRWAIAFAGSMATEVGAGLAGGCTASLAISGGAVLAPSAFLFMIGMFAGGIPALALVTRRRSR